MAKTGSRHQVAPQPTRKASGRRPRSGAGRTPLLSDAVATQVIKLDDAGNIGKPRRKEPLWPKLTVTFGAVLLLLSGLAVIGMRTAVNELTSNLSVVDVLGDSGKAAGTNLDGPIDLLLLGIDVRDSWEDKNATRADTVLLLHVPASHDQAYLMSIPRDSVVDIPANPETNYSGSRDKINAAFYFGAQNGGGWAGGIALTAKTVSQLTGITFDGAMVIDFGGFKRIIDTLGSVNLCVDTDAESLHYYKVNGEWTYVNEQKAQAQGLTPYVHKKGCQEMASWQALDYSRIRKSLADGDYGRQRHQQQLIKAMAEKATSKGVLTDFGKVHDLIEAAGKTMLIDSGGRKIEDFLFTLKDLASADLVLLKTNSGHFNGGAGGEMLSAQTMNMFAAARTDTLGRFVLENPDVRNKD